MPTIIGSNALEWKMKEMARRSGKKYELEEKEISNRYEKMSKDQLKAEKAIYQKVINFK
jgi:hypothetical protein